MYIEGDAVGKLCVAAMGMRSLPSGMNSLHSEADRACLGGVAGSRVYCHRVGSCGSTGIACTPTASSTTVTATTATCKHTARECYEEHQHPEQCLPSAPPTRYSEKKDACQSRTPPPDTTELQNFSAGLAKHPWLRLSR